MKYATNLRIRGFTIIEALIVIAILGILGTIAAPSMRGMLKSSKVRTVASDFYAALLKARSESIKRRLAVTVAPVGGAWTAGWTVSYGSTTLTSHDSLASDVTVQNNVPATAVTSIVYGSNGRVSSAAPTLIFYTADDTSVQARCVSVDPAGLPRVRIDTNGSATDGCN
jgi:type IV fimbrial biogenesis protein FimT